MASRSGEPAREMDDSAPLTSFLAPAQRKRNRAKHAQSQLPWPSGRPKQIIQSESKPSVEQPTDKKRKDTHTLKFRGGASHGKRSGELDDDKALTVTKPHPDELRDKRPKKSQKDI
eukprot:1741388-Pyramimonas_sp.AAC.1